MIGSGNVATHLAIAISSISQHSIEAVYSPHVDHAEALAKKVGAPLFTNELAVLPEADCYIFSVKDAFLEKTISEAKEVVPHIHKALCIHTAGSMPLSLFKGFAKGAVLYPMQTFSKEKPLDFSSVPLFIEASTSVAFNTVESFAHQLSQSVMPLDSERRKKLHLAAVFANNFTNHCCALAYKLLSENGIAPTCLLPIIDETMRKLHSMKPLEAQTGPAVRWDENVIQMQKSLLATDPQMQHIYEAMSQSIHHLHTTQTNTFTPTEKQ